MFWSRDVFHQYRPCKPRVHTDSIEEVVSDYGFACEGFNPQPY